MTHSLYQWRIDKTTSQRICENGQHLKSTTLFCSPQMVRGVRSQANLEEEGASCQVLAWHAFSRWAQAWRWAWGERTTVTHKLNHHHQGTNFLGPSMCELNLPRGCRDNLCHLGGASSSVFLFCHWKLVLNSCFLYGCWKELRPLPRCFHTKGRCCSFSILTSISLLPLDGTYQF